MKASQDSPDEASSLSSTMGDTEVSSRIVASDPIPSPETINRTTSCISGHDAFEPAATTTTPEGDALYREAGDEIFDKVSQGRKRAIVTVLSFGAFLSPISSTSVLAATPEVAATYNTTGSIINLSNAVYMIVMALSPLFWGPMSQVYGRRVVALSSSAMFFVLSLATALAPNLASFIVFRAASAFGGTAFILIGPACIGDIYRPTERGAAMGWFLTGTLVGPAFGPFLGGIIVTYSSWRSIFWLQTGLAAAGVLGVYLIVSETAHQLKIDDLKTLSGKKRALTILSMISPMRVLRLFQYPNIALVAGGSASLTWNMYSLLTPIRYVLNPRFHLETPLLSGLFYLSPGFGYLAGTFVGGHWADYTVKRWIKKRGARVPEDRLRSTLPFMGAIIPGSMLIYGWAVDQEVGGIPLPVIAMFVQGVAQLFCFPSYNTYCLDVMPGQGAEVAATNFFARYLVGCAASAVVLPAVEAVGIGWFSTISAAYLIVSALATMAAIRWGKVWRERTQARLEGLREK
ncbi:major facilitator superfamily domain-containing protein [Fusarium flagelliforme]|uniref:Dityrosine transporter n=1 Tax=Fusarium flagelliforme TaxID=2675880 RepID=A0A395MBH4_9HYPO|nr:major facilitator superfamily domain-containing protein [Fusarium flagelliforme]KAH7193151.1 major facilitator superfamily domain-containing protein [Fusarium flagelliforme]RFN45170.1 dityrosine transporter [Fusarium flagelliforme]